MPLVNFRLNEELYPYWLNHCRNADVCPSTLLRCVVEELVTTQLPPPTLSVIGPRTDTDKHRTAVYLTSSETDAIKTRTDLHGGTRAGWIIRAIRAALTGAPSFDMCEVLALRESNLQLVRIGNNLNQIARKLNDNRPVHADDIEAITTLKASLDDHLKHVSQLIDSNTQRWDIGP